MDVEQKRAIIIEVYKTDTWRDKVKRMSEAQVIAVYLRFQRDGKI